MTGGAWRLYRGTELVGEIEIDGSDFPWLEGRFVAHPGFAEVKPLFDEELRLADEDSADGAWDAAYYRIRQAGLRFVKPDGREVAEFLLHIQGDRGWFRWSDEPFPPMD